MENIFDAATRVYSLTELLKLFHQKEDRKSIWSNIKYNNHCDVVRVCIDRYEILIQICMPALELIVATHMQFCNGGSLLHSRASGAGQIPHSNVDTPHHSQNPSEERNIRVF